MARLRPFEGLSIAALTAAGLLAARIAVAAPLSIESDSGCPSGSAVADALAMLSPATAWPSGTVRIQSGPDLLIVDLIADGATRRELRVPADCGVRATTVALVVAAWTGELSSDAAGAPVLREPPPPAPVVEPPPAPTLPRPLASATRTTERELGAAFLLSLSDGLAPGMRIDYAESRAPRGLGWQVGVALPARRELVAGGGTTRWTRATASLALKGRLTLRRLVLAAHAGLAGAYTLASGQGYSIEPGSEALTGGLVAGLRVALPWRRLRVWSGLCGYHWLYPQTIAVEATGGGRVATVALPAWDFEWALGLAYVFR
jgi:hypothetical protein